MLSYISVFFLIFTSLCGVFFLSKLALDFVFGKTPAETVLVLTECEEEIELVLRKHLLNGERVTLVKSGLSEESLKIAERLAVKYQNRLIIK